ncbi:MAG: leucine-rich repeat domain-containing protein [Putridiphycobacter sp.]
MKPEFLSKEVAQKRFNLSQFDPLGIVGFDSYVIFDGQVEINTDLEEGTFEELFFSEKESALSNTLFIVNGNLKVNGDIAIQEGMPCLLVLGDVHCDVLHSFDNVIHVIGDAHIKYAFNGHYNHGSITVEGATHVPYLLNSDHDSRLSPTENTIKINYYTDWDDFFQYDYYQEDLYKVVIDEVLSDDDELEYDRFIEVLKSGKSPLKEGAKPSRVLVEEMIAKLANKWKDGNGIKALDLTEKKLLSLPKAIFEIESLEELNLEDNGFTHLPEEITQLKNLRKLNLRDTGVSSLPEAMDKLENLEELNLNNCRNLKQIPQSIGNLKNLKKLSLWCYAGWVPKEITNLSSLEELDIYGWYQQVDEAVDFPEWIFELKGLKTLRLNNNSFKSIPDKLLELKNLEYLNLNSALCYAKTIPDLSLLNLKVLEADGRVAITTRPHVQHEMLQNFFKIKSLEHLRIDSYCSEERYLNGSDFNKMWNEVKDDPEKAAEFKSKLRIEEPNSKLAKLMKGRDLKKYFYTSRRAMTPADLKGIDNLQNLKYLDIAWNKLDTIPSEIFKLKKLEHIKLNGNNFSETELNRLKDLNPKIVIE